MKTTEELEQAILDILCNIYCKKYIGKLKVKELFTQDKKHLGYLLKLELNKKDKPFTISIEGDWLLFLTRVKELLRISRLNTIDYFEAFLVY